MGFFNNFLSKTKFIIFMGLSLIVTCSLNASPANTPTPLPTNYPTPQVIKSLKTSGKSMAQSRLLAQPMDVGTPVICCTIAVDGLMNCPDYADPASEANAAVKVQVTPGVAYQINLLSGCISYGSDDTGLLYGTRLRIRQAADTNGTGLTSSYNTVGYGAYDYGPVYYNCSDAQSVGFSAPYNPATIIPTNNYLYFTTDDVYGGYCGDNGGSEILQIYQLPLLQDIWTSYNQQQAQINDITLSISTTAGAQINYAQYLFKLPNRFKYSDTVLSGIEAAYNGTVFTSKNKVTGFTESTVVSTPNTINKIDTLFNYKNLTSTVIELEGTTLNERGQQSILLNVIFQIDPNSRDTQIMFGFCDQREVLFDYTEGVARQIVSLLNGNIEQTINYYYNLNNGILVPESKYTIDASGNTLSIETCSASALNQGLSDSIFVVNP
jgi:hypothetical protein